MDCPICLESFKLVDHIPRVFPCGHGICDQCMKLMLISGRKPQANNSVYIKFECPQCKRPYSYQSENEAQKSIGKNFALLAFLESKIEKDKKNEEIRTKEMYEMKR